MRQGSGVRVNRATRLAVACCVGLAASAPAGDIPIVGTWTGTTCGTGADVWGEGDLAYWAHFGESCVDIVDVSNPADPQWVSSFQVPSPDQFTSAQDVKGQDGLMYVGYGGGGSPNAAGIVDVRDPANPTLLTTLRPEIGGDVFTSSHNLFYHEGYLYFADSGTRTVWIVDLTGYDPDDPPALITSVKWRLTGVGTGFVHDITVLRDRLYVSAWDQIIVYDITNIDTEIPTEIAQHPGNSVHAAWATDDDAYVLVTEERSSGGLKLFGYTADGNDLVLLDEVIEPPETFSAHNVLTVGDRVYTSWYASGLIVHEIDRDAGQLVEIGRVDPGNTWGVYPYLGLDRVVLTGFGHFTIVDGTLCSGVSHDWDQDGDVDFYDYAAFQVCAGGGGIGCSATFDNDCDGDIDSFDLASYLDAVTGPNP